MLLPRKIVFFLLLFVGLSLYAQQNCFISSYVRGNFYNRGRISAESLRASDDLIFLNVRPNKDGSLSFENPRIFENGKGVTSWEELIKSVRADGCERNKDKTSSGRCQWRVESDGCR